MKTSGKCIVKVELTITERFVYRNAMVSKVWVNLKVDGARSNAVHYAGTAFYNEDQRMRGRMLATDLPEEILEALRSGVRYFMRTVP